MYNAEQKERFIRDFTESENTAANCIRLFNQTEPFEEKAGCDLCAMRPEDPLCRELASKLVSLRGESREKRLDTAKSYVKWCVKNEIPGASLDFLNVTPSWYGRFRERMTGSPGDLLRILDASFDRPEQETVDVVYRCFLWLSFMGLDAEESVSLTAEDVSLPSRTVTSRGKAYPIPSEAMEDFRKCRNLPGFTFVHPKYNRPSYIERPDSPQFLRGQRSETDAAYLSAAVYRAQKKNAGEHSRIVSCTSLQASGLFYRTYEAERAGIPPDFKSIAERETAEAEQKRGETYSDTIFKQRLFQKRKALEDDYERWKFVFGI